MSYFFAAERAEVAGGDVDDAVREAELRDDLLLDREQPLVLLARSPRAARTRTSRPCRTGGRGTCRACPSRPRRPRGGSTSSSRRSGAAARLVEDLLHVQRRKRDLGRARQVELVALDVVDVDVVGREEARAVHRRLADEHRRQHRDEALARRAGRARSGRARAPAARPRPSGRRSASRKSRAPRSMSSQRAAELEVVARLEPERRGSPTRRSSSASSSVSPSGARRVRRVGHAVESSWRRLGLGELVVERLQLRLQRLRLLDLLRRRLALHLLPARAPRRGVWTPRQAASASSSASKPRRALARERRPEGVGVVARRPEVDHATESR